MNLSKVGSGAGVTPAFHYPCYQKVYLKWAGGVTRKARYAHEDTHLEMRIY